MSNYYVMKGFAEESPIVLYSLLRPSNQDNWMLARRFSVAVTEPVEVTIVPDNEVGVLMPFYEVPQIIRNDVFKVLVDCGVDNVDVYRAVVKREDGTVISEDYLAYNILGAVRAVDLSETQFAPENPSRMVDASIEKLLIDEQKTKGLLMFRLAESIKTIVVHEKIKQAIEATGIPHLQFLGVDDHIF